jgi:hypothetical protein
MDGIEIAQASNTLLTAILDEEEWVGRCKFDQ